jgi:hypothetical protein
MQRKAVERIVIDQFKLKHYLQIAADKFHENATALKAVNGDTVFITHSAAQQLAGEFERCEREVIELRNSIEQADRVELVMEEGGKKC